MNWPRQTAYRTSASDSRSSAVFSKVLKIVRDGYAYYTDGEEITAEPYSGKTRKYHCGKEYQRYEVKEFLPLLMVVVDAGEASVGITNGEIIEVLWSDTSWVPRKHDAGGQSQRRFERGRDEALKHWLRKVVDVVMRHHDGRRLVIGGPGMTKDRFVKELPGYVADKVDRMESCGYTCDAGLYELLGKSRYAKV